MRAERWTPEGEVVGVYFDIEELKAVIGLSWQSVQLEIVAAARNYEEIVVFRRLGPPAVIVGTLHKTGDGFFVLTIESKRRPLSAEGVRATFATLAEAVAKAERVMVRASTAP